MMGKIAQPWKFKKYFANSRLKHWNTKHLIEEYRDLIRLSEKYQFIGEDLVLDALNRMEILLKKRGYYGF